MMKISVCSVREAIKRFGLREVINSPSRWYSLEDTRFDGIYSKLLTPYCQLTYYSLNKDGMVCCNTFEIECKWMAEGFYIYTDSTKEKILEILSDLENQIIWMTEDIYKPYPFVYLYEEA